MKKGKPKPRPGKPAPIQNEPGRPKARPMRPASKLWQQPGAWESDGAGTEKKTSPKRAKGEKY